MRSYLSHLQSIKGESKEAVISRASSLFPVQCTEQVQTRLLFMNYWHLKRGVREVNARCTLRNQLGEELHKKEFPIDEVRAYSIEVQDLLKEINRSHPFQGTVELEFFSSTPLVFPFPAVTINYYGPDFSTVVHTTERTYNDEGDEAANTRSTPPESGFNVIEEEGIHSFITLVNGKEQRDLQQIEATLVNSMGKEATFSIPLGVAEPYQLYWLKLSDYFDVGTFLNHELGAVRLTLPPLGAFPRLLVGNASKKALSITHSYYDCSTLKGEENYWQENQPEWHAATLMLPLYEKEQRSAVTFYPIFSPSQFTIDAELYDQEGKLLKTLEHLYDSHQKGPCTHLIEAKGARAVRMIARTEKGTRLPSRVKIALDVTATGELGSNICTNLQPFIPELDQKPFTFKWAPLLNQKGFTSWITLVNSSQHVNYNREADISLTFYREEDSETLTRSLRLAPHGSTTIQLPKDKELLQFLGDKGGWMTATSDNPYILSYYFIKSPSGNIGGDHGY